MKIEVVVESYVVLEMKADERRRLKLLKKGKKGFKQVVAEYEAKKALNDDFKKRLNNDD